MGRRIALALCLAVVMGLIAAPPALAADDLGQVINNLRTWLAGLLAALATLLLMVGGVRYLLAGGDPGALERAKGSIRASMIGYALALLAPVLASIVRRVVGA
jgi:type IV secretion system pilin